MVQALVMVMLAGWAPVISLAADAPPSPRPRLVTVIRIVPGTASPVAAVADPVSLSPPRAAP